MITKSVSIVIQILVYLLRICSICIYGDILDVSLDDASCVGQTMASIIFIYILYVYDIVLIGNTPYDLGKELIILKDFFFSMGMTLNMTNQRL
jgi:hypothetical protein